MSSVCKFKEKQVEEEKYDCMWLSGLRLHGCVWKVEQHLPQEPEQGLQAARSSRAEGALAPLASLSAVFICVCTRGEKCKNKHFGRCANGK